VDAQFAVSVKQFGTDNLVNAGVGVGFVIFSLHKLGVMPQWSQALLYVAAIALGVAVHYSVMFCLATASFWIIRAQGLIYGYYSLFNIARYPDVIFRGVFKLVFSWLVPVIVVSNVPARLLMGFAERPALSLLNLAVAAALVTALTRGLWRLGLRSYSSASS
jgi:ABC-2 type transport system permease protein